VNNSEDIVATTPFEVWTVFLFLTGTNCAFSKKFQPPNYKVLADTGHCISFPYQKGGHKPLVRKWIPSMNIQRKFRAIDVTPTIGQIIEDLESIKSLV